MNITEPKPATWREKQDKAKALLAEVKSLQSKGVSDHDTADKAKEMMAEAQRLAAEVREEKLAAKNSELATLVKEFETQTGQRRTPREFDIDPLGPTSTHSRNGKDVRFTFSHRAAELFQIKAQTEDTGSAGGFLAPAENLQSLFAAGRRQGNALLDQGWLSVHDVNSHQVLLPKATGAALVGIVAENATKPSQDMTFSQITVNIFTWAGIAKMSRQLFQDSEPGMSDVARQELGTLLGNLEEQKIINGSGTGEPRGILNTTGINAVTYTDITPTGQETLDAIIDAISQVQQNYFAPPTGILMHPRRLSFLLKSKDLQNNYILNPGGSFRAPSGFPTPTGPDGRGATVTIAGLPVLTSSNVPTNLGTGTNEDRIIVADWKEAHWLQREDVRVDISDTAGTAFETNQVWVRVEERSGFTAERYPTAFSVVSGTGLVTPV